MYFEPGETDSIFSSLLISQIFGKDVGKKDNPEDTLVVDSINFKSNIFSGRTALDVLMQKELVDLNIIVNKNVFGVHQLVMCAHSGLLEAVIQETHAKGYEIGTAGLDAHDLGDRVSILLPDYSWKVMAKVLDFLYSGELLYCRDDIQEMKSIASDLQLKHLSSQLNELTERERKEEKDVQMPESTGNKAINFQSHLAGTIVNSIMVGPQQQQPRVHFVQSGSTNVGLDESQGLNKYLTKYLTVIDGESCAPIGGDNDYSNIIGVEEKVLLEVDLETPVQSPIEAPPNSPNKECAGDNVFVSTSPSSPLKTLDPLQIYTHQCDICSQLFNSEADLNNHNKSHNSLSGAESLQCEVCKINFNSTENLEKHQEIAHEGKSFQCEICSKYFTRSNQLKIHKRIHTGVKPYPCTECSKRFIDNSGLKEHIKTHSDDLGYKCVTCNKGFKLRSTLRQHMMTHKEKSYKCNICNKGFTLKRNMLRHAEIHTQVNLKIKNQNQLFKCNHCHGTYFNSQEQLSEHNLSEHPGSQQISTSLVYRCWMRNCSKVFPSEDLLTAHRNIVHESADIPAATEPAKVHFSMEEGDQELFICSCGVKFVNARTLKHHQKTWHTSGGGFKCTLCNKGFKNDCDLLRHMLEHSDGEKQHICGYCSKAWTKASDLAKHIRVHTGEKPYKCDICHKEFADVSFFKKHKRKHENSPSYTCDICSKSFQLLENLEKHQERHNGLALSISCSMCSKVFYDELLLQAHLNLHTCTPLLPFPCQYCHKQFKRSYDMRKHERVHTKEQPYACAECSTRFSDLSSLRRHQKIHLKAI